MGVLHFQDAVENHHKWLDDFIASLSGADEKLCREQVVRDDLCVIGQWLHGEGIKFSHLPEFQAVKDLHKTIHDIAARAWDAKKQHENQAQVDTILKELEEAKHALFMSWNDLNFVIGSLD